MHPGGRVVHRGVLPGSPGLKRVEWIISIAVRPAEGDSLGINRHGFGRLHKLHQAKPVNAGAGKDGGAFQIDIAPLDVVTANVEQRWKMAIRRGVADDSERSYEKSGIGWRRRHCGVDGCA